MFKLSKKGKGLVHVYCKLLWTPLRATASPSSLSPMHGNHWEKPEHMEPLEEGSKHPPKEKGEKPAHLRLCCNAERVPSPLPAVRGSHGPSVLILHYYISTTVLEKPRGSCLDKSKKLHQCVMLINVPSLLRSRQACALSAVEEPWGQQQRGTPRLAHRLGQQGGEGACTDGCPKQFLHGQGNTRC